MNLLIPSLISHGHIIALQLVEAKRKSNSSYDIYENVRTPISELLKLFDNIQATINFTDDETRSSVYKVLQKIDEALQKFIQLDDKHAPNYMKLKDDVNEIRRKHFPIGTSSQQQTTNYSYLQRASSLSSSLQDDSDFEDAYGNLSHEDLQCLFCFLIFSSGEEIKKRELIHWWIGMNLIENSLKADQVLRKLVDEGLIDRVMENKKIYNRYKMHKSVGDKLATKMNMVECLWQYRRKLEDETISIIHDQHGVEPEKVIAFLNVKRSSLNAKTFEDISRTRNIKVLSLGISGSPHLRDCVIEIDRLSNLKSALSRLRKLRCLSLEGISRIVELPITIYKLKNLEVLDLKACHDLMIIPKGIDSLSRLTHLDLSMCHMLNHVPKGVASLRSLVVLKGFVINDESNSDYNGLSCSFDDLSALEGLVKLSIRTRRMNFPKMEDLDTLHKMEKLANLKIIWVGRPNISNEKKDNSYDVLPPKLIKVELEAAPATTASRLLELISKQVQVEKVYIKGGRLCDFGARRALTFAHVKFLRLRYLHNLHINWSDIQTTFPNLNRLEMLECPNLMFFPCDQNGVLECLE